jgi:hypothetical protein
MSLNSLRDANANKKNKNKNPFLFSKSSQVLVLNFL